MNIFMPEFFIEKSVQALDDRRLVKQILECKQIISANDRVNNGEERVGYANHPIVKFYRDKRDFVVKYGLFACWEYFKRFKQNHVYEEYFYNEEAWMFSPNFVYNIYYMDKRPETYESFATYDIREEKIITQVHLDYREKLKKKWALDGTKCKWTNREKPEWASL